MRNEIDTRTYKITTNTSSEVLLLKNNFILIAGVLKINLDDVKIVEEVIFNTSPPSPYESTINGYDAKYVAGFSVVINMFNNPMILEFNGIIEPDFVGKHEKYRDFIYKYDEAKFNKVKEIVKTLHERINNAWMNSKE